MELAGQHCLGDHNRSNISLHNYERMDEGMVFVLHTQWLELSAGWSAPRIAPAGQPVVGLEAARG
ncbi:hypothetical protein [Rhizobium sp. LC145]|uniref:hypothetical protein n=1 Tax=Rhizobium sp. LC145 TaxID=1120688 RepID=UPI0009E1D0DA|nr:hypothetical protein [Rhizobium sp. LC145]TKT67232.1 hypothetical protein FDR95_04185 [Rhizobiaceae bacterium LC148]